MHYDPVNEIPFYSKNFGDIRLNVWEYHDMVDALLQDKISDQGQMKFKRMYQINSYSMLMVPVIGFPIAFFAQKWLHGIYKII